MEISHGPNARLQKSEHRHRLPKTSPTALVVAGLALGSLVSLGHGKWQTRDVGEAPKFSFDGHTSRYFGNTEISRLQEIARSDRNALTFLSGVMEITTSQHSQAGSQELAERIQKLMNGALSANSIDSRYIQESAVRMALTEVQSIHDRALRAIQAKAQEKNEPVNPALAFRANEKEWVSSWNAQVRK